MPLKIFYKKEDARLRSHTMIEQTKRAMDGYDLFNIV